MQMDMASSQNTENTDSWQFRSEDEKQSAEAVLTKLLPAVESGQNIDQLLSGFNLPEHVKQKLRRRLHQALQEKETLEHQMARETREKAAVAKEGVGFGKLFSMSMLSSVISKQTIEKIQLIFSQNPQLANIVKEQGMKLARNGVAPDLEFKSGQTISAPTVAVGLGQQQSQQR